MLPLAPVDTTHKLCVELSVDEDTIVLDDKYHVYATGYAIQTDGFESKTSKQIWQTINGDDQ